MPLVHSIRRSGRLAIAAMVLAVLVGCSGNTTEVFFREHVVSPGVGSVAIAIYEVGDAFTEIRSWSLGGRNQNAPQESKFDSVRRGRA